jgi:hypothetical protein
VIAGRIGLRRLLPPATQPASNSFRSGIRSAFAIEHSTVASNAEDYYDDASLETVSAEFAAQL